MPTRPPKAKRPSWSHRLHVASDDPPVVVFTAPDPFLPLYPPPPPLALNLNVSAEVPTLETM